MRILLSFLFGCFVLFGFGQTIASNAFHLTKQLDWLGFSSEKKVNTYSVDGSPKSILDFLEADLEEDLQESEDNPEAFHEASSYNFYCSNTFPLIYSMDFLGIKSNRFSGFRPGFSFGYVNPLYRKNGSLLI